MAELDPIVARILLAGDDELLKSLERVGEEGAEHIKKLAEAAEAGLSPMATLSSAIGLIEAAVSGATAALVVFIEKQTELSRKTELLADAFGVTSGQLQDIEATFASAGVKVEQFERFANRLTITIAREWPQIAESIKTYATENDAAQLRVTNSILRIQDAQKALADNSAERSSTIAKDNLSLEQSYIKLQFAAQHAAQEQLGALQSVRGASLGVVAAQQRLAELEGRPPSAADKKALELAQAQQAVDTARKAEADARIAQQEKAASAALKIQQDEQAYADLARKAAKDARDDAEQRQKDENALKEAVIARAEAEQKAAKLALTNIDSIKGALDGIVKGNKDAASAVDLQQVSVKHLTDAIIAQAKETAKGQSPTGYETLIQLSKTLSSATEDQISKEQKLAIVNRLAGTSMQALGVSAAEILYVLEHDTAALEHLNAATKSLDTEEAKTKLEAFRGALAQLNLAFSVLSQQFAIAISPAFTAFLIGIRESLQSSDGVLHQFIEGIKDLVNAIGFIGGVAASAFVALDNAFGGDAQRRATEFKIALIGIVTIIGFIAGPFIQIPILIGLVITAMGGLTEITKKVWEAMQDNAVMRFWERLLDVVAKVKSLLSGNGWRNPAAGGGNGAEAAIPGNAAGGLISGPGSGTSDSILSRLSNGEFVVKAAAVQAYGAGLFHALNNMQLPGFAQGGLVASPVRVGGGSIAPATSTLNLSIDGRSFNGLKGPKTTIDDLSSFAISRQASAAGSNPGWYK
jgi:hypothetical protein